MESIECLFLFFFVILELCYTIWCYFLNCTVIFASNCYKSFLFFSLLIKFAVVLIIILKLETIKSNTI